MTDPTEATAIETEAVEGSPIRNFNEEVLKITIELGYSKKDLFRPYLSLETEMFAKFKEKCEQRQGLDSLNDAMKSGMLRQFEPIARPSKNQIASMESEGLSRMSLLKIDQFKPLNPPYTLFKATFVGLIQLSSFYWHYAQTIAEKQQSYKQARKLWKEINDRRKKLNRIFNESVIKHDDTYTAAWQAVEGEVEQYTELLNLSKCSEASFYTPALLASFISRSRHIEDAEAKFFQRFFEAASRELLGKPNKPMIANITNAIFKTEY